MLSPNIINNKTARSVFYIIVIGGLLSLSSIMITMMWNAGLKPLFDFPLITFLESVGIVAFVYVIYFGIKFSQNDSYDKKAGNKTIFRNSDISADELKHPTFHELSDEEKEELKTFVSQCCGMPRNPNPHRNMQF